MIKAWVVDRLKPFELADRKFRELDEDTPAVVLDRSPRGAMELADVAPFCFVRPHEGRVQLLLVDRSGKRRTATRDLDLLFQVRPNLIAYVPSGNDIGGLEVWEAVLVVSPPTRKVDRPWEVERYYHQVARANVKYDASKAWATAWSIFCAYKEPSSRHCKKQGYF